MPYLAPLAARQLAAWEQLADGWPLMEDAGVRRCVSCLAGVELITDPDGRPYRWTEEQHRANIVLHLRHRHPDLDPDLPL